MKENSKKSGSMGHGPSSMSKMSSDKPHNAKNTIKKLLKYLGKDKKVIFLVIICVIASTILMLAGSYLLRPIVNGITSGGGPSQLLKMLGVMLILYVLSAVIQYFQMRIMLKVSQRAVTNLRRDLFAKLQSLPIRYFDSNSTGDVMSKFTNDIDAIGDMLNMTMIQVISGVIQIIGTIALMFYTNWLLALITIVVCPLMMFTTKGLMKLSRKYYNKQQEALGTLNGYIEETVSGQKVVKVFNHEQKAKDEFDNLNSNLKDKQVNAQFLGSIMGPVIGNMGQLTYVLVSCIGGVLCVLKGFDIGGLTVFVNYARQFARPISEIAMQTNLIFAALAGAERVFKTMEEEPELEDNNDSLKDKEITGEVEAENVVFGYNKDKVILKNISFKANKGERIAFVGSTGAGKTTITNLINRFYDVDDGEILIDGKNVKDYSRDYLRQNVAMVLQDTHLFSGTIRENIRFGRIEATDEEVENAAKVAGAHSFIKRLEHGYDTELVGDGSNLSQGQRQLLNIARAAISYAPILILDEATSSVDTRTERHIEEGLARIMSQRTTLVIAHRLSTVVTADEIIVLEQGEIIERGKHEQLLEKQGRYYQLYNGIVELA